MAQLMEGDNRGIHRGLMNSAPGLPPRFPNFTGRGSSLSDFDAAFLSNQSNGSSGGFQRQRQSSACTVGSQEPNFQSNGFPDNFRGQNRRGSHRRSASDSFTYLESPGNLYRFSNIAEEDESEYNNVAPSEKLGAEDGDQLNDLLEEIQHLQNQQNLPISSQIPPSSSKSEISNLSSLGLSRTILDDSFQKPHFNSEIEVPRDGDFHDNIAGSPSGLSETNDPKQAKRVLSNRQSAQRSRVRKLQYIAELERIVNVLQMDVSSLSSRVLYLQHQHMLLNIENNTMKQRIAARIQEKSIKDSQNETLMDDVRRLKQLHDLQVFNYQQKQQQQQRPLIQRHSSLPSDLGVQLQQYSEANAISQLISQAVFSATDSATGLVERFSNMSMHASSGASNELPREDIGSNELALNVETGEGKRESEDKQTSDDISVQKL